MNIHEEKRHAFCVAGQVTWFHPDTVSDRIRCRGNLQNQLPGLRAELQLLKCERLQCACVPLPLSLLTDSINNQASDHLPLSLILLPPSPSTLLPLSLSPSFSSLSLSLYSPPSLPSLSFPSLSRPLSLLPLPLLPSLLLVFPPLSPPSLSSPLSRSCSLSSLSSPPAPSLPLPS